jgi:thiamine biosynthesis protein ThiI
VPKHPATKPKLEKVIEAEQKMEYQKYIDNFEEEVIEV